MAHGRTRYSICFLTAALLATTAAAATDGPADEHATVAQVSETLSAAAALIGEALPESLGRVRVDVADSLHADQIRTSVTAALIARGIEVTSDGTAVLTVFADRAEVTVADTRRDGLFGGQLIERRVSVTLAYRLLGDGDVSLADHANAETSAWVPEHAVRRDIESSALELPPNRAVTLAETGVVMGSVAVVIYLFFTQ